MLCEAVQNRRLEGGGGVKHGSYVCGEHGWVKRPRVGVKTLGGGGEEW